MASDDIIADCYALFEATTDELNNILRHIAAEMTLTRADRDGIVTTPHLKLRKKLDESAFNMMSIGDD